MVAPAPTSLVRYKFLFVVGLVITPLYLANPSALVELNVLNGEMFSSNLSGGYILFGKAGLYFVSVMALGTKASPGLGGLSLNAVQCTFFPMEAFTFPPSSNFSMAYLVEALTDNASFRPYVASTANNQTIEFICSMVKVVPDS